MKIDRVIDAILGFFFGFHANGERKAWFHSQNLNEDRNGDVKGWPYHGRCFLHVANRTVFRFSWNLWTHFCGVSFKFCPQEDGWVFFIGFPPFAFWLSTTLFTKRAMKWISSPAMDARNQKTGGHPGSNRYTTFEFFDISFHDKTLFWAFLKFDWGWSHQMPKWMSGSFHPLDVLLGRVEYTKKILSTHSVKIPMPEGSYPATVELEECTWKRPRWFGHTGYYAKVDVKDGIPHEGKGENSWDCGKDALYGLSREAKTVEEAIAATVECALKSRRKYDGNVMASYPSPQTT